ncbi:NAD-dependent epimerase [Sphaerisporangium krabiense]|uniref:Nucleoside-diphosphate-sugar epimerase n=1 Tax=Sphaerisporangium krabiense TaxID=763782 RepID=A0A7W8Z6G1_9ACTN|nr:NAD-dependent epimerase/dehydratase family protein [Sphaerisporangium krabiense]MBB5628368.1 nucleoside-diphosphate-sugar epimerase [Sphaerisporangium krabiense]GII66892.1 NAD-dependent epimerase [Sphaerisporangium krabiense]
MRVIVVGATGNVGTSVISALERDSSVEAIVGVARRLPGWRPGRTEWRAADIATDDLTDLFTGADAVVNLAWLFQPTRDPAVTWRANVLGGMRVFRAVAEAGVPALVHASSVGAYSPGPKDRAVDESWPTHGWPRAAYAREKAYLERVLDVFENDHPGIRVVRMRPGFIFKRESATQQRRLFAGPLVPQRLVRPGWVPFLPDVPGLRIQALHSDDAGEAYRLAVTRPVSGPFNLAADPVLEPADLAELLRTRLVPVAPWMIRELTAAAWHLRLVPASPGLVEMALKIPVMDTTRARTELGWTPRHTALQAVREVVAGMEGGAGMDTPPLEPESGLKGRLHELATGVGGRP